MNRTVIVAALFCVLAVNAQLPGIPGILDPALSQRSEGSPGSSSAMTNGLKGYWNMSGTGSESEVDLIGPFTMVVSSGDTIPTTNNTPLQPARLFDDGDNDYMQATNVALSSSDSFTVGGWFRADSISANRNIIGKASTFSLRMVAGDSTLRFVVANASTNKEVVGQALSANVNYFFGASYNVTNGAIQLLICSPTATNLYTGTFLPGIESITNTVYISATASGLTANWSGSIDDIWLSGRAMATNELISLHGAGSGVAFPWTGL